MAETNTVPGDEDWTNTAHPEQIYEKDGGSFIHARRFLETIFCKSY